MLAVCGLPLFFMELALGQYHGKGPNIVFKHLAPAFHGLGFGMLVITFLVVLYYNMILAWSIFYMFASFTSHLGWENCGNSWNSNDCFNLEQTRACEAENLTYFNNTCFDVKSYCSTFENASYLNLTHCWNDTSHTAMPAADTEGKTSPSEEYYLYYMLGISPDMATFGQLRWQLVLCLLAAWVIVALCLIKGVKSSGKVVYFTALFPYAVLFILLIRGATLEGSGNGIYFYIVPEWDRLLHPQAWGDAAVQIFYSLGPGFGGLLTLASYNKFNSNCCRDAIIIAISNCSTSIFAGFVIFSIIGFMAHTLQVPVESVVKSGPGLAFIAYPEAVTKMPLSPLWAFLFFFMLITLGLDSQFVMCETLITAVQDQWPKTRKRAQMTVIIICTISFLLGLPLCAQSGIYIFTLIDSYAAGWSLLIIALIEMLLVSWVYGIDNFKKNIAEMTGVLPNFYWSFTWKYASPITALGILIFSIVNYVPVQFGDYIFPWWANVIGFLLAALSIIMVPVFAGYEIWKCYSMEKDISSIFRPSEEWGPSEKKAVITAEPETNGEFNIAYVAGSEDNNGVYVIKRQK